MDKRPLEREAGLLKRNPPTRLVSVRAQEVLPPGMASHLSAEGPSLVSYSWASNLAQGWATGKCRSMAPHPVHPPWRDRVIAKKACMTRCGSLKLPAGHNLPTR